MFKRKGNSLTRTKDRKLIQKLGKCYIMRMRRSTKRYKLYKENKQILELKSKITNTVNTRGDQLPGDSVINSQET